MPDASPDTHQRDQLRDIVAHFGLETKPAPVTLASGAQSKYFVDAKQALSDGEHLRVACELIIELAEQQSVDWNVVGGMTMGADPIAHGVALLTRKRWFTVRKERKDHGTQKVIEAVHMGPDTRVLLIDDVVTTGGSIAKAYKAVAAEGAQVVLATALVDRGDTGHEFFDAEGVPYVPLLTYKDLGIPPIGSERYPEPLSA